MSVHNKLYVKTELFANRIDGTDLTTADWAFLGTVDQNLASNDEVTFQSVTYDNASFTTKIQTGATSSYTLTLPVDDGTTGQALTTDGSGVLSWLNFAVGQPVGTGDSVQFVDLTLTGNLTVSGTTTLIETTNTVIKDNIILLNNGEVSAGIGGGTGTAGVEIARGSLTNVQILFDETTDKWTLGTTGAIGTTRYIVSEIADASQTQGAIPGYDASGRFAEAEGLTAGEVDQLQNIDSVTISNTQWGYVGGMDQDVTTTSNVTFNNLTVDGSFTLAEPIAADVSAVLTADPAPVVSSINIFSTAGGAFAATLPDATASLGKSFMFYLAVASGNNLTITAAGSDTIDGTETTLVLDVQYQRTTLTSVGTVWVVT